jgi:hypothetical protein
MDMLARQGGGIMTPIPTQVAIPCTLHGTIVEGNHQGRHMYCIVEGVSRTTTGPTTQVQTFLLRELGEMSWFESPAERWKPRDQEDMA